MRRLAGLAALVIVGALGCGRENLALGKPVQASSVRLGDPAGAVNGLVEWGSYAVHTWDDSPAWIVVDLGRDARIDEVRIFNRGDEGANVWSSRVTVLASSDGRAYDELGTCAEIFTQASPCSVEAGGFPARYVKLEHEDGLVFSEVEVFEAR